MKDIGVRLKEAREEAGYATAGEAAVAFGWNENTYRSAENGYRAPGRRSLVKYAKAFRVSVDWLLTGRSPKRPSSGSGTGRGGIALRQIPLMRWSDINSSNNLKAQLASADARGFIVIPESEVLSADAFALEVQDDSMIDPKGSPLSLYPGDTVVIDPEKIAQPGNMVLARDGKKAMIRKVRVLSEDDGGGAARVALVPLNPDFATKEVSADKVLGVMTGLYRRSN